METSETRVRMHAGVCMKASAQTTTHPQPHAIINMHTASAVTLIFFPARQSRSLTLHPGCRGFSRPLGDWATWLEKHTACKMFHHYHPSRSAEAVNIHISILLPSCANMVQMSPWALYFFKEAWMRRMLDSPLFSVIFVLNLPPSIVGVNQLTLVFYSQTK